MKDLNGNEYFTKEKVNEIICEKFKDLDIFTKEQGTEIIKLDHEYFNGLNYVYIEYTNKSWSMKRYAKLVYGYAFTFLEFKDSNVKILAVFIFENVNKLVVVSKDTVILQLFPAFKLFPALSVKYNLSFAFKYIAIKLGLAVVDVYIE